MAGPRSPNETSSDCLVTSFRLGWKRQISNQLAGIKQGQAEIRSTQDRHLVLTGQVLEAMRMGKPTEPPSGPVKILWAAVKEWLSGFVLLQKAWSAFWAVWPKISWPVNITVWGSGAAKWLGWL